MIEVRLSGMEALQRELAAMPDKLRKRALAAAWRKAATVARTQAKRQAPVLDANKPGSAYALKKGIRAKGTVRKAISLRPSGRDRKRGDVGVFINVRPAKGGNRGGKNPRDPFYWRWLEFGRQIRSKGQRVEYATGGRVKVRSVRANTGEQRAAKFLQNTAALFPQVLSRFVAEIKPAFDKLARRLTP
jgi:HK97 gp10 family phage protein